LFGIDEFKKFFKVRQIVESGVGSRRRNAARLRILSIGDEFVYYQSVRSKNGNTYRISYLCLDLLVENFDQLNPRSITKSVNRVLKRAGVPRDFTTETYSYSLAKAYRERASKLILLGELHRMQGSVLQFEEGNRIGRLVEIIDRRPGARKECIKHFGPTCQVCGFNFEEFYGEVGKGFIHVHHHRLQLAVSKGKHKVDPINDLIPLCPNCHAMAHQRNPMLSIEELRSKLSRARSKNSRTSPKVAKSG
jgi:HNH endonuclease